MHLLLLWHELTLNNGENKSVGGQISGIPTISITQTINPSYYKSMWRKADFLLATLQNGKAKKLCCLFKVSRL